VHWTVSGSDYTGELSADLFEDTTGAHELAKPQK
jgi:hypothetical protein